MADPGKARRYQTLRGRARFAAAYSAGVRHRCGAMTIVIAAGPPGPPQVGFVAGKRVGSAVARNRAKRRMRAAAFLSDLKRDTVYVLVADRGVLTADFERLVACIDRSSAGLNSVEETS